MKSPKADIKSTGGPSDDSDKLTGLPWLRTWRGVYVFVFGFFVLWVVLLLVLTLSYP